MHKQSTWFGSLKYISLKKTTFIVEALARLKGHKAMSHAKKVDKTHWIWTWLAQKNIYILPLVQNHWGNFMLEIILNTDSRIFHSLRRHHCRWRTVKLWPTCIHVPAAYSVWSRRDLYRATPAMTQDLGLHGLDRRTAPFSRLLRQTRVTENLF